MPGRYRGKLIEYGAKTTMKGEPAIALRFAFEDENKHRHEVIWQGSLSQGTDPSKKRPIEITLETLGVCGFDFHKHKTLEVIADGTEGGALDCERELMITVEHETWDGKPFAKARFVNPVGGFKGGIDRREFVVKCAGLNLEAEILSYRQKAPKPTAAPMAARTSDPRADVPSLADIPF